MPSPPQVPFIALSPFTPDNLHRPFPVERKDTMNYVCGLTEKLSDTLIQIIHRLENAQDFVYPVFKLGPEEEQPTPQAENSPVDYP